MASREQSQFGRRRSNTATSNFNRILPAYIPLKLGDTKVLNAWVHDQKDQPSVIFNQTWWPGVAEGDLLRVSSSAAQEPDEQSFLFLVPRDEGCSKPQLQVCEACAMIVQVLMCRVDICSSFYCRCVWVEK